MEEVKKVSIPFARHLALASQTRRKATRTAWETVKQKFIATPISNLPQGEFIMGGWHGSVSQNRQVAILVNEFDNVHAVSGSWVRDAKPASKAL